MGKKIILIGNPNTGKNSHTLAIETLKKEYREDFIIVDDKDKKRNSWI